MEELKAAWDYLPDRAWFAGFFERDLVAVASAKRRREELWGKLVVASIDLERAEGELAGRIRATTTRNWTPEQIADALAAARDGKEGA